MSRRTISGVAAFVAVLAVALTAGAQWVAPDRPSAAVAVGSAPWLRVMPLGDSITEGSYVSASEAGYRQPLWDLAAADPGYGLDFVGSADSGSVADTDHEGHFGWRIDDVRARIGTWMAAADPDVVLLHIGINDLTAKFRAVDPVANPLPGAVADLKALVNEIYAASPSTVIVLHGLIEPKSYSLDSEVAAFNAEAALLPEEVRGRGHRLRYVDSGVTKAELPDGLHPGDTGYRKMAVAYAAAIAGAVADGDIREHRTESIVEHYAYPGREEILAARKLKLKSGSGSIQLADCAAGTAGVLEVVTTASTAPACFRVDGRGNLTLIVPGVRTLRLRGGTLPVTAQTWTGAGIRSDVTVQPSGATVTVPSAGAPVLAQLSA